MLIRAIGQGGVSTVYAAVDAAEGRTRAIKVLAAGADAGREAMITDRLRHPGVPRVFEYGEAPLPDGTVAPYLVLELLRGVPLGRRLSRGPLPWREAARIAATTADVLTVAHCRGVVHRDLSARNVMLTPTGPKLIDFGLATAARRATTPAWSHPRSMFADDVYSLGVLLYEMVTGRSPYPPAIAATVRAAGRTAHLAPTPVLAVPGLPSRLRDLVRACMAKTPHLRPAAKDVALDLWGLLSTPEGTPIV
ncbi:hypothetical protein Acsp02_49670 [Actinoplanes sp. NBRC 103695]|nr:hypothetical protein Acsp02_49670 [Actinoplanes sp. NBRC 103695]